MRKAIPCGLALILGATAGLIVVRARGQDGRGDTPPSAKSAVALPAPMLPAGIVDDLQERRYDAAVAPLARLAGDSRASADSRAGFGLILGSAERLAGRLDAARAALRAAIDADPKGRWATKLRFELAAVEAASGRFAEAERLARDEVVALLGPDRKDRLASIYRGFAREQLEPKALDAKPDYEGAIALLDQARRLAKGETLRARLLFEIARAAQAGSLLPRAEDEFARYVRDHPGGADRSAARFHLGEVQLARGESAESRRTWTDLARDLDRRDDPASINLRARALYQVGRSFPMAVKSGEAELGITALRRFLAAFPAHPLAVRAAFEIGEAYEAQEKDGAALDAYRAFLKGEGFRAETDEARTERARLSLSAAFRIASALRRQGKYDEAIAAWREYLGRDPNGPQSAEAHRAIRDTQLQVADDLDRRRRRAEARAAWTLYAAENPLDPRLPDVLFQIGRSDSDDGATEEAVAAWDLLVGKYPDAEPAAHAQYLAAVAVEERKGDPAAALARLRKVTLDPWASRARARIALMESTSLAATTPRVFRTGEPAVLKVRTRNVEALTISAYRLDPEAYFRRKHALGGVESLDIGLVAPDASWSAPVPGHAKYKPVESEYPLKAIDGPGAWVVKVGGGPSVAATVLVLVSDIDAIVKTSRDQALVFVEDMKAGKGRAGARVLLADASGVFLNAKAGGDGVLIRDWPEMRAPSDRIDVLVLDGANAAGSGLELPASFGQTPTARAFLATDRPAYRPGQEVALRGVVRERNDDGYDPNPGGIYQFEVVDPKGRRIVARDVTLSPFGTFHERVRLDESAAVGTYVVRVSRPRFSPYTGKFEVQAYQLAKVDLEFDLPRTVYYRGEVVKADLVARYQYGTPLSARPVEAILPDGRRVRGATDAAGRFPVEFPTEGFSEEQSLTIRGLMPGEGVETTARVSLALRGFSIDLATNRDVYLAGESFALDATAIDPQGGPVGVPLAVAVLKRVDDGGRAVEREVATERLTTDAKDGRGSVRLRVDDADGGSYVLRATGTDRFGNGIVAERSLTISGKADPARLRLLADRPSLNVGEPARVDLHNRTGRGPALVTWEAGRILDYRVVDIADGANPIAWEPGSGQYPDVTLAAARMDGASFHEARIDLKIERELRVTVAPARPSAGPGEEVEVEVTTLDVLGRPVAAELSLALVDRALLRQFPDKLPTIDAFFRPPSRVGSFTSTATNTFRYAAEARSIAGPSTGRGMVGDLVFRDPATPPERGGKADFTGKPLGAEDIIPRGSDPRSRAIVAMLARPLPMSFPQETPLEDVLKYIRGNTQDKDLGLPSGIPIYVDPVGLQEVEKTMQSPVVIDLEGVPLRTTLRLMLKQMGLTYKIEDGLLTINSAESDDVPPTGFEPRTPGAPGMAGMGMGGGMGGMGGGFGGGGGRALRSGMGGMMGGEPPQAKEPEEVAKAEPKPAAPGAEKPPAGDEDRLKRDLAAKAEPEPRMRFVETAYWNPSVVTGPDGKARVRVRAPSALSEYRFTARGVTAADTLAGQTTADLAVRKAFFVDLRLPSIFTQGDRPRLIARLHHAGVVGPSSVKLTVYAGGREEVFPKTIDLKADGVDDVAFDPFDVPEGGSVRLTLRATAGEKSDEVAAEVPIRPWGVQVLASASGSSSDDATAFVELPAGRTYESPEMLIEVSPSARRLLVDLVLGRADGRFATDPGRGTRGTNLDRASDLLATASVLAGLRGDGPGEAGEIVPLSRRARDLAADLIGGQNDDGGWSGTPGGSRSGNDRETSARAVWALTAAEPLGLVPDPKVFEKATAYLATAFAETPANDPALRATLLHALALRNKAGFEAANALNRARQDLPDPALALLALTFARLDRPALAVEVLGVLEAKARTEPVGPGEAPRAWWEGAGAIGAVETTALVALAEAKARPRGDGLKRAVAWLLAHRGCGGWETGRATGPAVAALAEFYGPAREAGDRYRLAISVNDEVVGQVEVAGPAEGKAILVPRRVLRVGGRNRVRFDIEGRGTYGYAVTLAGFARDFGPDQAPEGRRFVVEEHRYEPAAPEVGGKALPVGFASVVNPATFVNRATQVAGGGRVHVVLRAGRRTDSGIAPDYLILEEHLPAGASLVEGSIVTEADYYTVGDGALTLYFAPGRGPGTTEYDLHGTIPGTYRVLPPRLSSASEPGRFHLGPAGDLRVLSPGEATTDPYRPTPDELLARGKAAAEAGRFAEAVAPLEELAKGYTLREETLKEVARISLTAYVERHEPRAIVRWYEVAREKLPEMVIPFDRLLVIGRAYADIGEHERAYLGWRALAEQSYLDDARIGGEYRRRGRRLDGIAFLIDLWRSYPDAASIEGDLFAAAQSLDTLAREASDDRAVAAELASAGVGRSDLIEQAARINRWLLARSPESPTADEVSLALLGDALGLGHYDEAATLAARFARVYPRSTYRTSFLIAEALALFHLGRADRALEIARGITETPEAVPQAAQNGTKALYLIARIHDARRRPVEALAYYRQVADQFTDAADAVAALTEKELSLPEVTVLRPKGAAGAAGPGVALRSRNIAEVDVKVYPVDLDRLVDSRRTLDAIARVDLAGIRPRSERKVATGGGVDVEARTTPLDLPLGGEGAYLILARGDERFASGLVIVTPLDLDVRDRPDEDRVRVAARDATGAGVAGVRIKVIGPGRTVEGETDLRGVFVAEGTGGIDSVVARQGDRRFAYRRIAAAEPWRPRREPGADRRRARTEGGMPDEFDDSRRRQSERLKGREGSMGGMGGGMGAGGFM